MEDGGRRAPTYFDWLQPELLLLIFERVLASSTDFRDAEQLIRFSLEWSQLLLERIYLHCYQIRAYCRRFHYHENTYFTTDTVLYFTEAQARHMILSPVRYAQFRIRVSEWLVYWQEWAAYVDHETLCLLKDSPTDLRKTGFRSGVLQYLYLNGDIAPLLSRLAGHTFADFALMYENMVAATCHRRLLLAAKIANEYNVPDPVIEKRARGSARNGCPFSVEYFLLNNLVSLEKLPPLFLSEGTEGGE